MPRTPRQSATGITAAVIYTRVSGDEQEREGLSLPAQLADCRRYAQQHDWIIGAEFQDVMSGKRDDRPEYLALLAEVRRLRAAGQNAVVVVKWLHRFGRRVSERVRCWEELDALGCPSTAWLRAAWCSRWWRTSWRQSRRTKSRQIGERVSSTWRHVTSLGWAKIGRVPCGYRLRTATATERGASSPMKVLEVDPETAPFVLEVFQKIAAGASVRSGRQNCPTQRAAAGDGMGGRVGRHPKPDLRWAPRRRH